MSYDYLVRQSNRWNVSIPLEQGNVLRPTTVGQLSYAGGVSIPLEQGNVLRRPSAGDSTI